ncbi:MAG: arsenate reductase ArsC [Thermoplasmatota archaeon]
MSAGEPLVPGCDIYMKKVLFLCTHNSCRSQMAEALLRHLHGDRYEVHSAGTEATRVNPFAIDVLREMGVDTGELRSKDLSEYRGQTFDEVVTVCDNAKEACPFFPGAKFQTHKGFTDPPDLVSQGVEQMEAFRRIRDEIKEWLEDRFG